MILAFMATLVVYVGSGPTWQNVHFFAQGCREQWWTHLLYVNNYFKPLAEVSEIFVILVLDSEKLLFSLQCMGETWYMANDMQLFLVSPLLIYPLWKWKRAGVIWLAVVTAASLTANVIVFIVYDFPLMMPTRPYSQILLLEQYIHFALHIMTIGIIFAVQILMATITISWSTRTLGFVLLRICLEF